MKHLSRDKLAKYNRFSYQPRFYKEEKEAFQFRVSTIQRQLDRQIAPDHVSSTILSTRNKKKTRQIKFLSLTGLCFCFFGILFYVPLSVYSVAVLFIFAVAFVKISNR